MSPDSIQQLEKLIDRKIAEEVFDSEEQAIETIRHWIVKMERNVALEQMRNEDA